MFALAKRANLTELEFLYDNSMLVSDAIWIISRGVVADDLRSGELVELPIDVDIVTGQAS